MSCAAFTVGFSSSSLEEGSVVLTSLLGLSSTLQCDGRISWIIRGLDISKALQILTEVDMEIMAYCTVIYNCQLTAETISVHGVCALQRSGLKGAGAE